MDRELIAMCDTPEIQGKWKQNGGDKYYNWQHKKFYVLPDKDECEDPEVCQCCDWVESRLKEIAVYIPSIDDMHEWIIPSYQDSYLKAYDSICNSSYRPNMAIKHWLAMYMSRAHNKTWDGKAWI